MKLCLSLYKSSARVRLANNSVRSVSFTYRVVFFLYVRTRFNCNIWLGLNRYKIIGFIKLKPNRVSYIKLNR